MFLLPIAIILGVLIALLRNTVYDRIANVLTLTSISSPEFFLAYILILYLALKESFERGIKLVHYGGGLTNSVDDPLFKFKKKFSNTFLDYRMALSIHNKDLFIKYRNPSSNRIIDFKVP